MSPGVSPGCYFDQGAADQPQEPEKTTLTILSNHKAKEKSKSDGTGNELISILLLLLLLLTIPSRLSHSKSIKTTQFRDFHGRIDFLFR